MVFANKKQLAYNIDLVNGLANKANTSHTHDDRYYTEAETNNLLNNKANSSHSHSATDITSGTLPLTRGGTGVTTLEALKTLLGISSSSGSVEIDYGRTVQDEYNEYRLSLSVKNPIFVVAGYVSSNQTDCGVGVAIRGMSRLPLIVVNSNTGDAGDTTTAYSINFYEDSVSIYQSGSYMPPQIYCAAVGIE